MAFSRGNQLCKVKAPTSVVIGQPDKDGNRRDCWGIPLSLDEVALRWFKLALVHADDLPREVRDSAVYQEAEALRDSYGLSAATVTQTYLSGLWTYTLEMMAATEGITLAEVEKLTKHVVIGVPANWRPDALLRLREAAQRVGIPGPWQPRSTLDFFSEPEAATLTLVEKQEIPENLTVCPFWRRPPSQQATLADMHVLQVGDIMIVCDCGGGTAVSSLLLLVSVVPSPVQRANSRPSRTQFPTSSRQPNPSLWTNARLVICASVDQSCWMAPSCSFLSRGSGRDQRRPWRR